MLKRLIQSLRRFLKPKGLHRIAAYRIREGHLRLVNKRTVAEVGGLRIVESDYIIEDGGLEEEE